MNIVRDLNLRAIYFETAKPSSVINKKSDGTDHGDMTYTMHDSAGAITTTDLLAVRTTLDFEPAFDYEIEAGWLDIDPSLVLATLNEWFFSCVAVPDIPAAYGGSVQYVSRINLEVIQRARLEIDSVQTAMMFYSATNHTNKIRIVINHPVGAVKRFQLYLQIYR